MTPVQNVAIMDNGDYEIITENEKYTCVEMYYLRWSKWKQMDGANLP